MPNHDDINQDEDEEVSVVGVLAIVAGSVVFSFAAVYGVLYLFDIPNYPLLLMQP